MAQDLDTVLQVVPKVEDTMLKTTGHLQATDLRFQALHYHTESYT